MTKPRWCCHNNPVTGGGRSMFVCVCVRGGGRTLHVLYTIGPREQLAMHSKEWSLVCFCCAFEGLWNCWMDSHRFAPPLLPPLYPAGVPSPFQSATACLCCLLRGSALGLWREPRYNFGCNRHGRNKVGLNSAAFITIAKAMVRQ